MSDRPDLSLPPRPGALAFMVAFLVVSVLLLSQLGDQTQYSAKGKLFAQPAFWPAVSVIGMTLFSALHVLTRWRRRAGGSGAEALIWLRAVEFAVWFMVYVWAVPRIGYLPATLVFTVLLALRMGYRRPATLAAAAATGFAIVLVFKTLLSVKIPGGAVYDYLPAAIRNFLILNF